MQSQRETQLWREIYYSRGPRNLFRPLIDGLLNNDPYLLFVDYQAYVDCQDRVSATFLNHEKWSKKAIHNVARMGKFSSDRAIQEYCRNIWGVSKFDARRRERTC